MGSHEVPAEYVRKQLTMQPVCILFAATLCLRCSDVKPSNLLLDVPLHGLFNAWDLGGARWTELPAWCLQVTVADLNVCAHHGYGAPLQSFGAGTSLYRAPELSLDYDGGQPAGSQEDEAPPEGGEGQAQGATRQHGADADCYSVGCAYLEMT